MIMLEFRRILRLRGCGLGEKSSATRSFCGALQESSRVAQPQRSPRSLGFLTYLDWQEQGGQRIQPSLGSLKIFRLVKNMLKFPL